MTISVIGMGRMGKAIATLFWKHNINFKWAARDLEKLKEYCIANKMAINLFSIDDAIESDIILPAFKFADCIEWLTINQSRLKDKILIDINVPFNKNFDDLITEENNSASEIIQALLPKTKVVGLFKNTFWVVFENPEFNSILSDVYITSDSEEITQAIKTIMKPLPFRFFDGGKLKRNRIIERMTLLSRELAIKSGNYPNVSFHLWGK